MKVWNYGKNGKLVSSVDVTDMAEARALAARWNAQEDRADMKVEIIANRSPVMYATKICAAFDPSPLPLFEEGWKKWATAEEIANQMREDLKAHEEEQAAKLPEWLVPEIAVEVER